MDHKRGNYFDRTFGPFYNENGALIDNFASVTRALFVIKENKADADTAAVASASLTSCITLTASASTARVVIDSDSMDNVDAGKYYMALQLEYADNNRQECILTENGKEVTTITITQDTVVGGA